MGRLEACGSEGRWNKVKVGMEETNQKRNGENKRYNERGLRAEEERGGKERRRREERFSA